MLNRLTAKIDGLEKDKADASSVGRNSSLIHETDRRVDEIQHTTVPRNEYKSDIASLHMRINELEKSKEDKVQDIRVIGSGNLDNKKSKK